MRHFVVLEQRNLEKFLQNFFSKIYVQSLIYGNCNREVGIKFEFRTSAVAAEEIKLL